MQLTLSKNTNTHFSILSKPGQCHTYVSMYKVCSSWCGRSRPSRLPGPTGVNRDTCCCCKESGVWDRQLLTAKIPLAVTAQSLVLVGWHWSQFLLSECEVQVKQNVQFKNNFDTLCMCWCRFNVICYLEVEVFFKANTRPKGWKPQFFAKKNWQHIISPTTTKVPFKPRINIWFVSGRHSSLNHFFC